MSVSNTIPPAPSPIDGRSALRTRLVFGAVVLALAAVGAGADDTRLQQQASLLVAAFERTHGSVVGVSAVDLPGAAPLIAIRPGELRTCASNQKLLTSAVALERLEGDFQFTTRVYLRGRDVIVLGDWDPTLGDPRLARAGDVSIYAEMDKWSRAIAEHLSSGQAGEILLCDRGGAAGYRHEDWPANQYKRWYSAPVARLSFHNNCFDVTFKLVGKVVYPDVTPRSPLIGVINKVRRGPKQIWDLQTNRDESVVTLTGTIKTSAAEPLSVAVNDPVMLAGRVLAGRIAAAGVKLSGGVRTIDPNEIDWSGARLIATTTSPLLRAMTRANKRSLNMAAECIFLRSGDGTWARSAAIAGQTVVDSFGLSAGSFVIRDGSGLSRKNRITPAAMTQLLSAVAMRDDAHLLLASLPISGRDGTMRNRLDRRPYYGRVLGKTGYVSNTSCLSGYVLDETGQPAIAFSVLANRVPAGKAWLAKALQDKICRLLVDAL